MLGNLLGLESCLRSGFVLEAFTDINRSVEYNTTSKDNKEMGILL